jgi:drug/metabolite transporter (DMT)-like permease
MVSLGYFVFGDTPDRWSLIGSAVVIASGLYLVHRERVAGAADRATALEQQAAL